VATITPEPNMSLSKMFFAPFACGKSEFVARCSGVSTIPGCSRRELLRAARGREKFGTRKTCSSGYCKTLKSRKTTKEMFVKVWRKKGQIWKCLQKKLGDQARPGLSLTP
jgi:hypothetical protein